jgi:hypothetical protein
VSRASCGISWTESEENSQTEDRERRVTRSICRDKVWPLNRKVSITSRFDASPSSWSPVESRLNEAKSNCTSRSRISANC